jgi:hypothetical protein
MEKSTLLSSPGTQCDLSLVKNLSLERFPKCSIVLLSYPAGDASQADEYPEAVRFGEAFYDVDSLFTGSQRGIAILRPDVVATHLDQGADIGHYLQQYAINHVQI